MNEQRKTAVIGTSIQIVQLIVLIIGVVTVAITIGEKNEKLRNHEALINRINENLTKLNEIVITNTIHISNHDKSIGRLEQAVK